MSAYSNNLWADEMGIDMAELQRERPTHFDQIKLKRKINKQADEYWARERFLARFEVERKGVMSPVIATPAQEIVQAKPKATKVGRYEFTDRQLEIAMRALGAHDTVR